MTLAEAIIYGAIAWGAGASINLWLRKRLSAKSRKGTGSMPRYLVQLESINPNDESNDVHFSIVVEADNRRAAIEKAKAIRAETRPDIIPARTWSWSSHPTAEK